MNRASIRLVFLAPVAAFCLAIPAGLGAAQSKPAGAKSDNIIFSVVVTDKAGNPIAGLTQEDFSILVDKQPTTIDYFSSSPAPERVVLLVDTSTSMRGFDLWRPAVSEMKRLVVFSNPGSRFLLITFNEAPAITADWTSDWETISTAMTNADQGRRKRVTALYDALILAVNKAAQERNDKRFVLLIAGGIDTSSKAHLNDVRRLLQESCIPVYCIALPDIASDITTTLEAEHSVMEGVGSASGGVTFFPDRNEVPKIMDLITRWTTQSYEIGFNRASLPKDGKFHKLTWSVKPASGAGGSKRGDYYYVAPKGFYSGN